MDSFDHILRNEGLKVFDENTVYIPNNLPYGIDTSAAIWDRQFLLDKLGDGDYSAWQFELDRCIEAKSEKGLGGKLLCDKRQPLHICKIPVIIQGAYYPPAIKFFKNNGDLIDTESRRKMNLWECIIYKTKVRLSGVKHGRKILKWIGHNIIGLQFVSKD